MRNLEEIGWKIIYISLKNYKIKSNFVKKLRKLFSYYILDLEIRNRKQIFNDNECILMNSLKDKYNNYMFLLNFK